MVAEVGTSILAYDIPVGMEATWITEEMEVAQVLDWCYANLSPGLHRKKNRLA